MTTFHDPPPQSRRAARQSEREHTSDGQPTVEGFTTFPAQAQNEQPSAAENHDSSSFAVPSADATPAQPAPSDAAAEHTPTPAAATPASHPPATVSNASGDAEPARERTLTRRELREMRAREEAANQTSGEAGPESNGAVSTPATPAPAEAARAAQAPAPAPAVAPTASVAPAQSAPAEDTATPAAPVQAPPVVPVARPTAAAAPAVVPTSPTSTVATPATPATPAASAPADPARSSAPARPSLADLAAAASAEVAAPSKPAKSVDELSFAPDAQVYVEPPALVDPLAVVPEAASDSASVDALSAFESLLGNSDGSAAATPEAAAPRSPLADLPAPSASAPSYAANLPAPTSTPASAEPERSTIEGLLGLEPATDSGKVEPAAPSQTTLSNARAEFDELARKRLDGDVAAPAATAPSAAAKAPAPSLAPAKAEPNAAAQAASSTSASTLSAGHWSKQANVADDSNGAVVARTIGSGSTATNALVLPAIPFATDIRGPLNSSGETMLTGSIDLPSTLSASGVSDRFDKGDIDSLLDLNDSDMVSTDSAPVRAVKAVSTFSNQSVTQTQKPKGTRALTVLLISAASMAVVVAGLLVAAFAFNML